VSNALIIVLAAALAIAAVAGAARLYSAGEVATEAPDPGKAPPTAQSVVRVRRLLRSYDLELERRADVDATRQALHNLRRGAGGHAG
jgi:hypothetical protein